MYFNDKLQSEILVETILKGLLSYPNLLGTKSYVVFILSKHANPKVDYIRHDEVDHKLVQGMTGVRTVIMCN